MQCRPNCGACCIAPSINQPFPGMPEGKAAGVRCAHLQADYRCAIFTDPRRPKVCASFQPGADVCGADRDEAMQLIAYWEEVTSP